MPTRRPWYQVAAGWIDSQAAAAWHDPTDDRIDVARILPFLLLHLVCLACLWYPPSGLALGVAAGLFGLRMFAITAVYHRLFGHRAYTCPRWLAFVGAWVACSSGQRGPLWWAGHHRHHHRHSDTDEDRHSPVTKGFWWSHMHWFLARSALATPAQELPDLAKRGELRWLDRFAIVPPLVLALTCLGAGWALGAAGYATSAWDLFLWGFVVSTVVLFHATVTINSLAHRWGSRRYATTDDSRNNWLLAVITLGEGWHNNHHYYPASARQGFRWWQLDITYLVLRGMAAVGLVGNLRGVPERVLHAAPATAAAQPVSAKPETAA